MSRIVRSVMPFTTTLAKACDRCTGVTFTDWTGGAAPTVFAVLLAVLAAATVVGDVDGALGGTCPSQFSIFRSPSMVPPPGSLPVNALKSSSVGVTLS